jgi:hypothetical protein
MFRNNWRKGLIIGGLGSVGASAAHALVEFNLHIPAISVILIIIVALTSVISMGYAATRHSIPILRSEIDDSAPFLPKRKIKIPIIFPFMLLFLQLFFSLRCFKETDSFSLIFLQKRLFLRDCCYLVDTFKCYEEIKMG